MSLGPWRAPRSCVEPSERLLPIVALSATVGKRVPPLTLLLRAPRAETLRSTPNAVRRPPRQGRPPLSTLRAPSIAEWSGQRLAPCPFLLPISRLCRLDPASDALSPRASEEAVARRPLPWAHHPRALSPRVARRLLQSMQSASTVSARPVDTLFPPPETEVPCGEEQVRAPCGASQPRPFGRGSAVAGYVTRRRRCFRRDCSCTEGLPLPDWARTPLSRGPGPSRRGAVAGASNLPRPCAFPRAAPGCPGGALPVGLREENPRCGAPEVLSAAGPPLARMGRPVSRLHRWRREGIGQALVQSPPDIRCMDDATGWVGTRPMGEQALS